MKDFYFSEDKPIIGDIIFDRRKNALILLENEKDLNDIRYIAPELYILFKPN